MNRRMIINSVGLVLRVEAALLLLPAAVGMLYGEKQTLIAFLISAAISLLLGLLPKLFLKPKTHVIYAKEGFIIVAFTWIMLSLVGAVPLVLAGAVTSYADAFFEIVSGFTTTGSSVIPDVEVLSHGALFLAQLYPLGRRYGNNRFRYGNTAECFRTPHTHFKGGNSGPHGR